MTPGRLDRTVFKHQTLKEASYNLEYWKKQSYEKKLEAANYLNSVAYNFDINNPRGWIKPILKKATGMHNDLDDMKTSADFFLI